MFFRSSLGALVACVGESEVGEHELPIPINEYFYGTSNDDKICLVSTNNQAQGLRRWICGTDGVPTDITGADRIYVYMGKGNDAVVVRGVNSGGCSCSCNINMSLYGNQIDYVYPALIVTYPVRVIDSPITAFTGNDIVVAGNGNTHGGFADGDNTYRGGPQNDSVTGSNTVAGNEKVWDPAGPNGGFYLWLGSDQLNDESCNRSSCSCGQGIDDITNDCPLSPCVDCEIIQPSPKPACPAM